MINHNTEDNNSFISQDDTVIIPEYHPSTDETMVINTSSFNNSFDHSVSPGIHKVYPAKDMIYGVKSKRKNKVPKPLLYLAGITTTILMSVVWVHTMDEGAKEVPHDNNQTVMSQNIDKNNSSMTNDMGDSTNQKLHNIGSDAGSIASKAAQSLTHKINDHETNTSTEDNNSAVLDKSSDLISHGLDDITSLTQGFAQGYAHNK